MTKAVNLRDSRKLHGKAGFGKYALDEKTLSGVAGSREVPNMTCEYCGSAWIIPLKYGPGFTVYLCLGCLRNLFR